VKRRWCVDEEKVVRNTESRVYLGDPGAHAEMLYSVTVTTTEKARVVALKSARGQPAIK